jgi:hypothetical protein
MPVDKRNFRKKIAAMGILDRLEIKDKSSSKRGAFYYTFNRQKYDEVYRIGEQVLPLNHHCWYLNRLILRLGVFSNSSVLSLNEAILL